MTRSLVPVLVVACVSGLVACRSGDAPPPTIVPPPLLYVAPPRTVVEAGGQPAVFTALLRGATATLAWSLQPPGVGVLSAATGEVVVYTPPAVVAAPVSVTLTVQGAGMTDAAAISVLPARPPVVVTPAATCVVAGGGGRSFLATLTGAPTVIAWSLEPPGLGSLSASGGPAVTYTPPAAVAAPVVVTLTARAANAAAGSATISLLPPGDGANPSLGSLSPSGATAGGPGLSLTVDGAGFLPVSGVLWNGRLLPSEFIGPTRLVATIEQGDVALAGPATVTVANGCGSSNPLSFEIAQRHVEQVNLSGDGAPANGPTYLSGLSPSVRPVTSGGGRLVVFMSRATNLAPGDEIADFEIFLRDTCFGEPPGCAPATESVSALDGRHVDRDEPTITPDGRFVAWYELGLGGVDWFTNGIYRRDTCRGAEGCLPAIDRVSLANDGSPGAPPYWPSIYWFMADPAMSADGRFVAFTSEFILVPEETTERGGVHVRDTCGAEVGCVPTTLRIGGPQPSYSPSLSADGRFLAFISEASDLVEGDTNVQPDLFVRDGCQGAPPGCSPGTLRASVGAGGAETDGPVLSASIGASGRLVTFSSAATTLVPGDINGQVDVFVRDTCLGAPGDCVPGTELVSVASDGSRADGASGHSHLSADGRLVVFDSTATNLVPGDTNGTSDVFLRDTCRGASPGCAPSTIRLSVAADGTEALGRSGGPAISADGRVVVFESEAPNLVPGDTNGQQDVFLVATGVERPSF